MEYQATVFSFFFIKKMKSCCTYGHMYLLSGTQVLLMKRYTE